MAKYRKISPTLWNDAKFRSLSDNGKLVFLMLLTHPLCSAIGTIRVYPQGLAPEIGWSVSKFRKAFNEVMSQGMVKASEKDGLIWLPNFLKYNAPESPNVLKSWGASFESCPECPLRDEVHESIKAFAERLGNTFARAFAEAFGEGMSENEKGFREGSMEPFAKGSNGIRKGFDEGYAEASPYDSVLPSPNQEQEQEQEQEKENARGAHGTPSVMPDAKMPESKYLDFARRFQNEVLINHGNTAPKITEALITNGARELDKAVRIDCIDWDEMQECLLWAITDDFWGDNLKSLAAMRHKTKNGITKIQSVIAKFRRYCQQRPPQGFRSGITSSNGCTLPCN